jgi:hypothetical protein
VARDHSAQAARAPLPALGLVLSSAQLRTWESFPDYRNAVPVLVYHGVGRRPNYLTVSRRLFAAQMHALKVAGFHTLTIWQYAFYARHGMHGLPARPILLTFDDGRPDAYSAVDTILRAYGFHATELIVPSWNTQHPSFSLSRAQLEQMTRGGAWNILENLGYGQEKIPASEPRGAGRTFVYLVYIPGPKGQRRQQMTFGLVHVGAQQRAQFRQRAASNMEWRVRQLPLRVPSYRPLTTAIPEPDYGQPGASDPRIRPLVLSWLDHHFPRVLGGDLIMEPRETLPSLYCRLLGFARSTPTWRGTMPGTLCAGRADVPRRASAQLSAAARKG